MDCSAGVLINECMTKFWLIRAKGNQPFVAEVQCDRLNGRQWRSISLISNTCNSCSDFRERNMKSLIVNWNKKPLSWSFRKCIWGSIAEKALERAMRFLELFLNMGINAVLIPLLWDVEALRFIGRLVMGCHCVSGILSRHICGSHTLQKMIMCLMLFFTVGGVSYRKQIKSSKENANL